MNIKEIRELIRLIEESNVEEFEMERSGVRVRIRKPIPVSNAPTTADVDLIPTEKRSSVEVVTEGTAETKLSTPTEQEESLHVFKAPIVGTFYVTPKPDAEPFVEVGSEVDVGATLCIIEAMKIFNQIESEVAGKIAKILVENGQPVEYGQPLFEIQLSN